MTLENQEQLLAKFNELNTVSAKFNFWLNDLHKPYALYLTSRSFYSNGSERDIMGAYNDFAINPDGNSQLDYNRLAIEHYKRLAIFKKRKVNGFDYDELKKGFEAELSKVVNKQQFVLERVKQADEIFSFYDKDISLGEVKGNFFKKAFELMYFNDLEYDLSTDAFDIYHLIAINDGIVKAQFRKYLDVKLIELSVEPKSTSKPEKEKGLSLRQQLQMLHYFGVISQFEDKKLSKVKKSKMLSLLLGRSEQNIREIFTDYPDVTTSSNKKQRQLLKDDLQKIADIFQSFGFHDKLGSIKDDIEKLG